MKCPKCNKNIDDDFKFCPYCGEKKPSPKICPNCELEHNAKFSFCPECGTQLIIKSEYDLITNYEKSKRHNETIECFDKEIELNSNKEDSLSDKREYLENPERDNESTKWYNKILEYCDKEIKLNPEDEDALRQKGHYLEELERYEEAIEYYNKAKEQWVFHI